MTATAELGLLPEWNLADLYSGLDSPQFSADLKRAETDCRAFAEKWRGKLAEAAKGEKASLRLAEAVQEFEALQDLLGRIMSYAGLVYAGNTTDPICAKFYGDTHEKITAYSTDLLFFQLELNRIDDATMDKASASGPLEHWRPWLVDIRKDKPHELDDQIEKLFHEKSVTGHGAWNRLFDETIASLRFRVDGQELTIEPTLSMMQDASENVRHKAADAIAATLKDNLRIFSLVTNTLAKDKEISDRWRGFEAIAEALSLSPGTVMSRLFRAREKLARALAPYLGAAARRKGGAA